MGRLWDDRLAEVWASPGKAGSGVVIGGGAVLTARHVVAGALHGGKVLARIVRPGSAVPRWSPMGIGWADAAWDVALLVLDHSPGAAEAAWVRPRSVSPVVVRLGTSAEPACEAVGFPDAEIVPARDGRPAQALRQSEQVVGTLLPAGQGKPPSHLGRRLPRRWMPLDVDTTHPQTTAGWQGSSGAGVVLPDDRLAGLVVAADPDRQQGRLYVVPLADVLDQATGLAAALAEVAGRPAIAQVRDARGYAVALRPQCLGADGFPRLIDQLDDLGAFGVKPADLPGEPPYLGYVPRDEDGRLREALDQAVRQRKLLLVVGASGAGKSRSAAQAVRGRFGNHRLLWPLEDALPEVAGLRVLVDGAPVLVWLDEIQQQTGHGRLRARLQGLLDEGAVVVGTIRRAELELLTRPGEVRNPAGEALSDDRLVLQVNWRLDWSAAERERGKASLSNPGARNALTQGYPLGVWCVAGPQLVRRFDDSVADEERPYRYLLVRTVLDWYRTGVGLPVPVNAAVMLASLADRLDELPDGEEVRDALQWALQAVTGGGRRTRQSLLSQHPDDTLAVHDYLLDRAQESPPADVNENIWRAALSYVDGSRRFDVGTTALYAGQREIARAAYQPLADAGDVSAITNIGSLLVEDNPSEAERLYRRAASQGDSYAMFNLAVVLKNSGSPEARTWYERAADAGLSRAMFSLGRLLEPDDPNESRRWYERAAQAGEPDAMVNLGALLVKDDSAAARRWYEQAAETGHTGAMYNLGVMLASQDPAAARQWYEQAAGLGDTGAMVNLGVLLAESDRDAAIRWLTRSAEAGNAMGMDALGAILAEEDPEQARVWSRRAADLGNVGALYNLGVTLAESDPEEARRLFEQAAEAGHTAARFNLGVLLAPSDPERARYWYEQAIQADPADELYHFALLARLNLGLLLANSDRAAALEYLRQAADAGVGNAVLTYALLLREEDPAAADEWIAEARQRFGGSSR